MSDDRRPPRRPENDPEGVRIIGADEAEAAMERDDVARRRGPDDPRPGDRPGRPPADAPEPVLRFPLPADEEPEGLPHWSDPPTGEYGAVGGGSIFDDPAPVEGGEWASFGGGGPRWRDGGDDWAQEEDLRNWTGETDAVGALDERQRDPDDFFAFDEFEQPPPRAGYAEAPPRRPAPPPPGDPYGDGQYYDDGYEYDEFDEAYEDEPIVVGGGRVSPGGPASRVSGGQGGDRDLGQAAIYGGILFLVAVVCFFLGPAIALILVTAAVTLSAFEFFTKLRELGHAPAMPVGVAASGGLVLAAYHSGTYGMVVGMALATMVAFLWFLADAGEESDHGVSHNIGMTLLGTAWIGMLGSFGGAILGFRLGDFGGDPGTGILMGAIIGTIGYDVGGLFIGQAAGRSPLSGASPNKTIEGLIGGCLVALIVSVGYGMFIEPFGGPVDGLKLGLAVAIAAPLGDLCQSMIKRDLGIKDMGAIIPGHGGLTDRFDGLLFVLPTVFFVAWMSDLFL